MDGYDAHEIEAKWQAVWEAEQAFHDAESPSRATTGRASTCSRCSRTRPGQLHMGHVLNYTIGDVVTHFRRRTRPRGAAPDGLRLVRPAGRERRDPRGRPPARDHRAQHRDDHATRCAAWAGRSTGSARCRRTSPTYYRWTQWLFLKFLEHGLVYRKDAPVNWCPNDQTVLANEQVVDGRCERCGAEVEARNMAQWFFKITAYADELLDDLATIDWPERTKTIQRNWIGRSEGAEILFRVDELDIDIPVFTTRPDTLFGATFFVARARAAARRAAGRRDRAADEVRAYVRIAAARGRRGARAAREDGRLHRPLRDEPRQRRADPDLGRRLRADGLRHRRDHGRARARRARLRVRARRFALPVVAGDRRRTARSSTPATLRRAVRGGRAEGAAIVEWLAERGRGEAGDQLPPARLELLAPALLGLPDPDRLLRGVRRSCRCRTSELPVLLPEVEDYRPKGKPPLARQRGVDERRRARRAAARRGARPTRWTPSSTRPGTSCATATRTTTTAPFEREIVDCWMPDRPVHRRHRPRERCTCSTRASS